MRVLIFLAIALLLGLVVTWLIYRRDKSISDTASTVQAILTAAAIILAGQWYFVERKGEPHADVSQTLHAFRVDPRYALVESHVAVKNVGYTLLSIKNVDIWLQIVSPPPDAAAWRGVTLDRVAKLSRDDWPAQTKPNAEGRVYPVFSGAELVWPPVRRFKREIDHVIEPGETDLIVASFVVPCSVSTVRVVANVLKDESNAKWWRSRSFARVDKACNEEAADE